MEIKKVACFFVMKKYTTGQKRCHHGHLAGSKKKVKRKKEPHMGNRVDSIFAIKFRFCFENFTSGHSNFQRNQKEIMAMSTSGCGQQVSSEGWGWGIMGMDVTKCSL